LVDIFQIMLAYIAAAITSSMRSVIHLPLFFLFSFSLILFFFPVNGNAGINDERSSADNGQQSAYSHKR